MTTDDRLPQVGFSKILYVTDLSISGRKAFPYAASLARCYAAEITVFHVMEAHSFEKHLLEYISEPLWEEIKGRNLEEARQILIKRKRHDAVIKNAVDDFCQECLPEGQRPTVVYDVIVEMGDPVDRILQKAHDEDYDLVVVAKHGHGVFKGALIGDTAQSLVRRSRKPVLVVEVPEND